MSKKILVTGSSGMVGRHLLENLRHNSAYEIIAPTRKELNLFNQSDVIYFFKEHQPELVIHLAAKVGGIQANIKNPSEFLMENLYIGLNVVNAAKENNIRKLINISSSCMYPKNREILQESDILTDELEPTNEGYALAKICIMRLCEYMNKQHNYVYKTLIPPNLYGPYDNFDPSSSHLIPAILRKLHEAKIQGACEVIIWGDGTARREFLYVEDFIQFILYAINNIEILPEYINVGLGADHTIDEYYQLGADIVGYMGKFHYDETMPVGMKKKLLDSSVAQKLGWCPITTLEAGLKKTYQYYLEYMQNGSH